MKKVKEYLKMVDVFELPVNDDDRKAAVDLFSHMVTTPYSVDYTVTMSKYAAHAINSHDELVAEVERLREFERDAMRYRWLRNCDTVESKKFVSDTGGWIVGLSVLDGLIDKAMKTSC